MPAVEIICFLSDGAQMVRRGRVSRVRGLDGRRPIEEVRDVDARPVLASRGQWHHQRGLVGYPQLVVLVGLVLVLVLMTVMTVMATSAVCRCPIILVVWSIIGGRALNLCHGGPVGGQGEIQAGGAAAAVVGSAVVMFGLQGEGWR